MSAERDVAMFTNLSERIIQYGFKNNPIFGANEDVFLQLLLAAIMELNYSRVFVQMFARLSCYLTELIGRVRIPRQL